MKTLSDILVRIDDFVWGPVMLVLLVGTGIFLTIRTKALCWRNLPYALKSVLSKEARQKKGKGDVSPFSALTTALAATIGTGNIVGVATAMVSGGPGALVWMWISAAFGLTSKFSECMLAIKYREVNEKGEMSGGPMYTMKKGFKNKKAGAVLGWLFALFAVIASFGIGNLTQGNSISSALHATFGVPTWVTGIVITILAMLIILGGIKSISKVSQVVVPVMALFYIVAGIIIIFGNIRNVPAGVVMIFKMAFSLQAVGGGLCGSLVASMMNAMRFGVARGVFSNEAGMGSAAITAAAASTNDPVRQGYINMTGTFWDTIVVCTITGLCIASSGVLGTTETASSGSYAYEAQETDAAGLSFTLADGDKTTTTSYDVTDVSYDGKNQKLVMTLAKGDEKTLLTKEEKIENAADTEFSQNMDSYLPGTWKDDSGNEYILSRDGTLEYRELLVGSALTIAAFKTVLGQPGAWLVCIAIALFAFSTILGWEYHGEKAFEYLFQTHKFNMVYRILFSLVVYLGATTTLKIAWNFSDIANALMAIPNLICLLALSGVIVEEMNRYQKVIEAEKAAKKTK
ncbi:MAG: sodium:alanine symporter family protein [Lachnospiraceae bacterium]|nr:sodium:alanine symporter family protein [Agathobacter sp.]MDD6444443.1 sodium:alanine symporter family protein [Lachnospiraceae bacterium]MDY4894104.1 sodium:alanine symporter family protein [Agathobacter sp.]